MSRDADRHGQNSENEGSGVSTEQLILLAAKREQFVVFGELHVRSLNWLVLADVTYKVSEVGEAHGQQRLIAAVFGLVYEAIAIESANPV